MKHLVVILFGMLIPYLGFSQNATAETLNNLAVYLDTKPKKKDIPLIEKSLNSADKLERAIAASILFKYSKKDYEEQMIEAFAIHDYVHRKNGTLTYYTKSELGELMGKLTKEFDAKYGAASFDKRVMILASFLDYQNLNVWAKNKTEGEVDISLARIYRGVYLELLLNPTKIDSLDLANKIDRQTQQEDLKN